MGPLSKSIALALEDGWPGRQAQIRQLLRLTGEGSHSAPSFFVTGPSATGKTAVVKALVKSLDVRHAYVQCTETMKPRQVLGKILTQLCDHKRRREDGFAGVTGGDNILEFMQELPKVCRPNDPTAYIVLDDCQHLARTSLLWALVHAREHCSANVTFVLISAQRFMWGEYVGDHHIPIMPTVTFTNYEVEEAVLVLSKHTPASVATADEPLYRNFCETLVYNEFCQFTRNVKQLMSLAAFLWPVYIQPIKEQKLSETLSLQQKVRHLRSPAILALVKDVQKLYTPGMSTHQLQQIRGSASSSSSGGLSGAGHSRKGADSLFKFELPATAQLLLIAAYVASYNKPTLDAVIFDVRPTKGGGRRLGKRDGQQSDRQAEEAKEAKLKGPHTFSLQRLLTLYHYMASMASASSSRDPDLREELEEEQQILMGGGGGGGDGGSKAEKEATRRKFRTYRVGSPESETDDLLMQLSSFVSMQLISQTQGLADPLDAPKYLCNLPENYVHDMADHMGIALNRCLKYA